MPAVPNPLMLTPRLLTVASIAALSFALAACGGATGDEASTSESGASDSASAQSSAEKAPPAAATERQTFLVTLRDDVFSPGAEARQIADAHRGEVTHVYTSVIKGFAVSLPTTAVPGFQRAMQANPQVEMVEADQKVSAWAITQNTQYSWGTLWGLDRSDQRNLGLSGTYTFNNNGAGVNAYIIDTGIRPSHMLLAGRVSAGYTAINDGNGTNDCNGHGTHVAGTVGGDKVGIAQGVTLIPVRVLDCAGSGSWSGVVAGMDWVAANKRLPAVANMSLGGGASSTVDSAVTRMVNSGVTVVVAAGNSTANACNYSPARAASAITVGSTTSSDARSSFSNYGTCVDVFAPGSDITSAWHTADDVVNRISGTSMASPHVAGAVALLLQTKPTASPAEIDNSIKANATIGKVTSAGTGSPNRLLFTSDTLTEAPTMSVSSLTGLGVNGSSSTYWRARATTIVFDKNNNPVSGAVVNGSFTSGGTNRTCTTNTSGTCSITSSDLRRSTVLSSTFTVNSISKSGSIYDATKNLPDPARVTINRP